MNKVSKKLLLVYPHERIRSLFKANSEVVFLDGRGWWVLDKITLTRRLVAVDDIEVNYNENVNLKSILKKLDWWGPIWHRWIANADQYELLKREALIYVLKIMAGLNFFEINNSIFHTGVSHHVDISLVEIACSNLKVPQVFLYANVINGRLLPMIQVSSIRDRRPLGKKVSLYDSTKDIHDFYINKVNNKAPVLNSKIKSLNRNFNYASYQLFYGEIRSFFANKLKLLIGRKVNERLPVLKAPQLKLSDHLRLIKQQKKALNFYLKNCMSHKDIQKTLENKSSIPLIAAHYQPEATSFPEGGEWGNHIDVVLRLRSLKTTGDIVYKEHPASWAYFAPIVGATRVGMYRSVSYYEQLLDLGCKFIPPDYDLKMQPQVNSWYLPISITGSICIERSLFKLPSIYTGHPIFKDVPGTYSMDEFSTFNEFAECIQKPGLFSQADVLASLSNQLNFTTIVNVLGVGSGQPLNDEEMIKTFNVEYKKLINCFL
jgi:hypothetical protein